MSIHPFNCVQMTENKEKLSAVRINHCLPLVDGSGTGVTFRAVFTAFQLRLLTSPSCPHCSPQDDKYWARRRKNNVAAKRSRDARRLKENQIAIRASFLEKENAALRLEVADLRKELGRCKNVLAKYETRHGPL